MEIEKQIFKLEFTALVQFISATFAFDLQYFVIAFLPSFALCILELIYALN